MTETKQNSLGTEPIGRLLLKFSVPTALTLMVNCLYNIVDQIFIGHAVGIKGVAATNVTFPIGIIAAALALLLGMAVPANVSLHLGRGGAGGGRPYLCECGYASVWRRDIAFGVRVHFRKAACGIFRGIALCCGGGGSVYEHHSSGTALRHVQYGIYGNYPRGWQSAVYVRSMMIGAALNVVLDPIFIFVFRWGIQGAALATIIGQIVSGVIALAYLPRFSHFAIRKKYLRLKWRFIGVLYGLAFPAFAHRPQRRQPRL